MRRRAALRMPAVWRGAHRVAEPAERHVPLDGARVVEDMVVVHGKDVERRCGTARAHTLRVRCRPALGQGALSNSQRRAKSCSSLMAVMCV